VFLLTAVLFLIASLLTRVEKKLSIESPGVAIPASIKALAPILPYVIIMAAVLVVYGLALDAWLGEIWSPYILPVLLLGVLVYDRRAARKADAKAPGYFRSIESATTETTGHIGALLFLMGLSICLGGIVERAELMSMVPETFGSIWTTMGLLVVVLVVIGMIMDPYGAVILVSATIATVAYRNGIDPVHFWMVVLVAFELGYLTPPVALNHLLTRQVVGEEEAELAAQEGETFWRRHEKILLPVTVMATALLIVAFGPLIFGY
jgi:TRAP-type C4-dicarboxylate transport system permease large subunit